MTAIMRSLPALDRPRRGTSRGSKVATVRPESLTLPHGPRAWPLFPIEHRRHVASLDRRDDLSSQPMPGLTTASRGLGERGARAGAWLVGLAAFVLYALTASPFVASDDTAEFQTLAGTHGIAHAGYPLHVLILEVAGRVPAGTLAYRANLVSALAGALAVALAYLAGIRYTGSRAASAIAAAALALSHTLWHEATRAEIYAFTLAVSAGAFLAWDRYARTRHRASLLLCGLLSGFALTGHLSSLALVGVLSGALLLRVLRGASPGRDLALGGVALAAGLTPLLLIALRDVPGNLTHYAQYTFDHHTPEFPTWAPDLWTRLRRAGALLSGAQYLEHGWFEPFQESLFRLRLLAYHLAVNELFGGSAVLAALGAGVAILRRGGLDRLLVAWLGLLLLLLLYAAVPMVLGSFFLPGLWILALFLASGLSLAFTRWPRVAPGVAVLLLALQIGRSQLERPPGPLAARPVLAQVWSAWPAGWSPFVHDASWEEFGRGVLVELPPGARLHVCWEEGTTFLYLRHALAVRTDVVVRMTNCHAARMREWLAEDTAAGAPVFTTVPDERRPAFGRWALAASGSRGTLWRLEPGPATRGADAAPSAGRVDSTKRRPPGEGSAGSAGWNAMPSPGTQPSSCEAPA